MAKSILKLKEKDKVSFLPTEVFCLPAPSVMKPEKREFVVDPRASMHMIRRKHPNSADDETARVSESPTTVFTANEEVKQKRKQQCMSKNLIYS